MDTVTETLLVKLRNIEKWTVYSTLYFVFNCVEMLMVQANTLFSEGESKKDFVITEVEIIVKELKVPYVPKFVLRAILRWIVDALIDFLHGALKRSGDFD